ncbi:NAC domain-containing protein [Artemisia annua]|uniref:NAC domain-containing protein n=1 Tax=Artemisia annua TaxID=35608 RepID=A0A2U1PGT9_ARTAN|nr:NAC domain-containing protein [Artemisia annua]
MGTELNSLNEDGNSVATSTEENTHPKGTVSLETDSIDINPDANSDPDSNEKKVAIKKSRDQGDRSLSVYQGIKKTLVFHNGRAHDGMHEYLLLDQELLRVGVTQYAPFLEEEWTDDTAIMVPGGEAEDGMLNSDETDAKK